MDPNKLRTPCFEPVSTAVLKSSPEGILSLHSHPSVLCFLVTKPHLNNNNCYYLKIMFVVHFGKGIMVTPDEVSANAGFP